MILIKHATVVNEQQQQAVDVLVKAGRIEKITADISASAYPEAEMVDAAGLHLLPGMIDD